MAFFCDPWLDVQPRTKLEYVVRHPRYATTEELEHNKYKLKSLRQYRLRHKLMVGIPMLRRDVWIQKNSPYFKKIPHRVNVFEGFWQCYEYFVGYEGLFRDSLNFSDEITNNEHLESMRNTNSVFVHIRRGDYMLAKNQKIYETCTMEYYEKAIGYMQSYVDTPTFFVFSDDIEWVKGHLKVDNTKMEFVSHSGHLADLKDWYCMMNCKHAIIANSSFSWLAAWLIDSPAKIVIAPKAWYVNKRLNRQTRDLVPWDWIRF